ncbi:Rap1a/Tai family immunity protein [Reyranella sp.]|uniref:Rap1a/Tai family immunity protein n=1 Tax=Reyranella sp. TaxID=1929291 RepID=UPI0040375DD7
MCAGAIQTFIALSERTSLHPQGAFCRPPDGTTGQAARAIAAYLDDNPSLGSYPFVWVAEAALQKVWPCKSN